MHLSFTFRNLDASPALREYAEEKLERIKKYFPDPIKVHVVLSQQRNYVHAVDVQITLHNGMVVKGAEATEDFHSSIDLVMAKIERQLRRYKDRIRDYKPQASNAPERSVMHRVVALEPPPEYLGEAEMAIGASADSADSPIPPVVDSNGTPIPPPLPAGPRIIREEKFVTVPMTVEEAIMRMNLRHEELLAFTNIETHEINVVYRRPDDTYGLIETTHHGAASDAAPTTQVVR